MNRAPVLRVLGTALVALLLLAAPARAQSNTAEMLQQAIRLYEDLDIDRSLVILQRIISPSSPFLVTEEQRVTAFKFLGAALALQQGRDKRDSAITFFRASIERDPFTDLDPQTFSPSQVQVFREAGLATFKVGLRPVAVDTIDPRTARFRFRGLTTHAAHIRLEVRSEGVSRGVIYEGESDGIREFEWDGLLTGGRLAPPGRYELALIGESRRITVPQPVQDSAHVYLELEWLHEPLEDSLAPIGAAALLPEQHPASAAASDLLKGAGIAAAALITQGVLSSSQLGGNRTAMGVVASGGAIAGVGAFFYRQSHRAIPQNMAENQRRRLQRDQQNAGILQRNEAKLRETRLSITPAAGAGR